MKKYKSITVHGMCSSNIYDNVYPAKYEAALEQINKVCGEIVNIFTSQFPYDNMNTDLVTVITYAVESVESEEE